MEWEGGRNDCFTKSNVGVTYMKNHFKVNRLSASNRCKCVFTDYDVKYLTLSLNLLVHFEDFKTKNFMNKSSFCRYGQ